MIAATRAAHTSKPRRRRGRTCQLKLEDLGPVPLAAVISLIGKRDRLALAATSSLLLSRVLEHCPEACELRAESPGVGAALARHLFRRGCAASESRIGWTAWTPSHGWWAFVRAGADPSLDESIVRIVSPAAYSRLGALGTSIFFPSTLCMPPRITAAMRGLEFVDVRACRGSWLETDGDWLPAEVRGSVKEIHASESGLRRIPSNMSALEAVTISDCGSLDEEWLPVSSRASIKALIASRARTGSGEAVRCVPSGMRALENLEVSDCLPGEHWLPLESRAKLESLAVSDSTITSIPTGLVALKHLDLVACANLAQDFVPESSREALTSLLVVGSPVRRVPPDMPHLEVVAFAVEDLAEDWLPASSSKRLRRLLLGGSGHFLRALPPGLSQLEDLELDGTLPHGLASGAWLPASSARRIQELNVRGVNVTAIPPNMTALTRLNVENCVRLHPHRWLPASSAAGVRVLDASGSSIAALPDMPELVMLDLGSCPNLTPDFLSATSARKLRALNVRGTGVGSMPIARMPKLEILVFGRNAPGEFGGRVRD
ncbi:unnamed protein product [Pedinophyceae sp. YPF-701]|nr:unnamed protein product [Pedinophyceae sp. YPF-701]